MSGRIPQAFIHELVEKSSIIEVIEQYVPLKKQGSSYVACCPFHNEKSPSFNVSDKKQLYHCFGCGAGGNVISFIMAYHNANFVEALEKLAELYGLELPKSEQEKKVAEKYGQLKSLLGGVNQAYQNALKQNPIAQKYLNERQLTPSIIQQFQLGFAPNQWHWLENTFKNQLPHLVNSGMLIKKDDGKCYDRYRDRIMFPIHNSKGDIIGFGGRVLSPDGKPKYLNSPETPLFHKSQELYGLYQAKNKPHDYFVIVEGYMDVIALHQEGIYGAVATMGTATSEAHLKKLLRQKKHLVFCFDGDNAGQNAALSAMKMALNLLTDDCQIQFLILPDNLDPDSYIKTHGKNAFLDKIKQSPDIISFLIAHLRQQVDLRQNAGRTQLIALARPIYQQIPSMNYQAILEDKISLLTRLPAKNLLAKNSIEETPPKAPIYPIKRGHTTPQKPLVLWQKALALLIQNPSFYPIIKENFKLEAHHGPYANLLHHLMPYLAKNLSLANLLEALRQTPYFEQVKWLASVSLIVPDTGIEAELKDAFTLIEQNRIKDTIQQLLKKAQANALSDEERITLKQLIEQSRRNQTTN